MKIILFPAILLMAILFSCKKEPVVLPVDDSVTLGANYNDDVFYSLANGAKHEVPRANWDIAVGTGVMNWSILINSGSGVELYKVSKDTSHFHSVTDTSLFPMLKRLHNTLSDWSKGSFGAEMAGGFDFDWGLYDHTTKNVNGSAVYLVKLTNGTWKKLMVRQKHGYTNTYYLVVANPDGSSEEEINIALAPYATKEYIYYSLVASTIEDREPAKSNWDLLFTRYYDPAVPMNPQVMGVLIKPGTKAMKLSGVDIATADTTMGTFSAAPAVIGYDWKTLNMADFTFDIVAKTLYFVKTTDGGLYKMWFTAAEGLTTGKVKFKKEKLN